MATVVHARELALAAVSPRILANDSVLTPAEKPMAVQNYNTIISEQSGIDAQAVLYGITTERTAYNSAVSALTAYLSTIIGWNVIPGANVNIVGATYRSTWSAVYTTRQTLLNRISAVIDPLLAPDTLPNPPASATASAEPFGIRINIVAGTGNFIDHYEYRVGASWDVAVPIELDGGSSYLWQIQLTGAYTFWIKSVDTLGQYSSGTATTSITISGGTVSSLSGIVNGISVNLGWTGVAGSFAIAGYEIRHGASWAGGTTVDFRQVNSYTVAGSWLGARTYWVAVLDVRGNYGTPTSVVMTIATPTSVTGSRSEVVDNNVLLYWTASVVGFNQLNIAYYDVRKGVTYAGGTTVGSNGNSTFTTVFEQVGGTFTYWVAPIDFAGNVGTAISIIAAVNQPPDYVFRNDYNSDLLGGDPSGVTVTNTLTNFYYDRGALVGPVDITDSWAQHYIDNVWTTPADQITAGFPIYNNPSLTTGVYEEVLDYGAAIPSTIVTVTLGSTAITGTVTPLLTISWKLLIGDAWTVMTAGANNTLIPQFRYLRINYGFTCTAGANLIRIDSLNVRLAIRLRNDSGAASGTANYTTGGIVVNFGYPFVSADTPLVQPGGSTALVPVVIYSGGANPTTFTVRLYVLSTGVELAANSTWNFSWTVRGY